ncbi:MAG TPA: ankyrin repeat domain-containing protein [Cyclobacteriaceae bacterium]|nr:ankyrin repeat domain-containing protein [Cyclobacteriaceae bacterium]
MKMNYSNLLPFVAKSPLLAAVFLLCSCGNRKASAQKITDTPATTVKPSMDIHSAVVRGNLEVIKQHLAAGTNINEKDPFGGSSPLISASLFGKTEIAKLLIDAGADINVQNNDGSTALHTAAFFCRPEIVKMLLVKKADKNIKNKYGATPGQSVAESFEAVKPTYEMLEKLLAPMGLKLDYVYIEKTRPEIAALLK